MRSTPLDDLLQVDPVDDPLDVDPLHDRFNIDPLDHAIDVHGADHGRDDFVGDGLDDAAGIVDQRAENPLPPPSSGASGTPPRGHTSFLQSGGTRPLALARG